MADFDKNNILGGESTGQKITSAVDELMAAFEDVNTYYIKTIADQIRVIGEMNPSSINRLAIMASVNENIADIKNRLQKAIGATNAKMDKILQSAYQSFNGSPSLMRVMRETPLSDSAKARLAQLAESVSRQTQGTLQNLSNTTLSWENYRRYVDQAVLAVTSGLGSYTEQVRHTVQMLGYAGMQVSYESGYHRRLDSAVRANIVSAATQIAQQGSDIVKEDLGMDAVELTAHAAPAPDHAPVQGRVFLNDEYDKMQAGEDFKDVDGNAYVGFRRKIGEWNCMHMALGFDTRYSARTFTDEQLRTMIVDNNKGCTINGRKYTIYQAGQLMRRLETEIRRQKDVAVAAEAAGDDTLRERAQTRINELGEKYLEAASQSGLSPKWNRTTVPGFHKY